MQCLTKVLLVDGGMDGINSDHSMMALPLELLEW